MPSVDVLKKELEDAIGRLRALGRGLREARKLETAFYLESAKLAEIIHMMNERVKVYGRDEDKHTVLEMQDELKGMKQKLEADARQRDKANDEYIATSIDIGRIREQLEREMRNQGGESSGTSSSDNGHHKSGQSQRPSDTTLPVRSYTASIQQWRMAVEVAFADLSNMTVFPTPPASKCSNVGCKAQLGRTLQICDCAVRAAFMHAPGINFKVERTKWHPDRFSKCSAEKREVFQGMAKDAFQVVDRMYEETK